MPEFLSASSRLGRQKPYIVGALFFVLLPALAFFLWPTPGLAEKLAGAGRNGGKNVGGAGIPVPVAAVIATRNDLAIYLDAPGTVTPVNSVVVRSRVAGQLQQVHFQEGELVKAGDLLAQIDPRPFEVQLAQAQAALARDEALLRNAQLDLERYQTLWSQDSISQQELDTQKALVAQYQSALSADRADIDSAKLQLTYSRITAPISGRVGLRQIDAGNMIGSADAGGLVLITQLQPINVVFTVPEDDLAAVAQQLQRGNRLTVEAWNRDRSRKIAEGRLLTFDNQVDPATGTVKLKALFDNVTGENVTGENAAALFPNQFVNVRLLVETRKDVTLIPLAAVQHGVQGDFVYQIQPDQTVKRQRVALGAAGGEQVSIISGLAAGAQIVLEGSDRLRDGTKIQIIGEPPLEQATGDRRPDGRALPQSS
jgi:membrane fusion protein, multidrug efflux system